MKPLAYVACLALACLPACKDSDDVSKGSLPAPNDATSGAASNAQTKSADSPPPVADPERAHRARTVAMQFGKALLAELTSTIETKGAAAAIDVCNERAPAIAAATANAEFRVRRIGTRVRNRATNTPTPAERRLFAQMEAMEPDALAGMAMEVAPNGVPAVYVPILLAAPMCLLCHGEPDSLASDVRTRLESLYPDDEATGYAVGDLRGAFVVEPAR